MRDDAGRFYRVGATATAELRMEGDPVPAGAAQPC